MESTGSLLPEDVLEPLAGEESEPEVVLEAVMLKHSRNRQWNERYFVFDSKHKLAYYDKKGDSRPKATFRVTRESGCEITDLYVNERQKGTKRETLYCFTITWPGDLTGSTKKDMSMHDSFDDASYIGDGLTSPPSSPTATIKNSESLSKTPSKARQRSASFDDPLLPRSRAASPMPNKTKAKASDVKSSESSITSESCSKGHRRNKSWFRKEKDHVMGASMSHLIGGENELALHRRRANTANDVPSEVKMEIDPSPLAPAYETIHEGEGHAVEEESEHRPELSKPQPLKLVRAVSDNKANRNDASKGAYDDQHAAEQDKLHNLYISTKKEKQKETRKKMVEGTKIFVAAGAAIGVGVVTAGVGLAAGLVFLGAAAATGGTAGVAEIGFKRKRSKRGCVTIATKSYEDAKLWKSSLDACLEVDAIKQSTWGQMFMADGRKTTSALVPRDVELMTVRSNSGDEDGASREFSRQTNLFLKDRNFLVEPTTRWRPLEGGWTSMGPGAQGLRIFREERISSPDTPLKTTHLAVSGTTCAPLKTQVVLRAHPLDAFMCMMSYARIPSSVSDEDLAPCSGQRASFRTIEKIDDHMDVVHLVCRKMYLFPSWTVPRDFVLFRYWRYEPDGSYIVCYESVEHASCPPNPRFVRGEMHQVCTIAPSKKNVEKRRNSSGSGPECLMTSVVQVDPKGWVPSTPMLFLSNQGYGDAFGVAALLQLLDIRDAIEVDRFLNVAPDISHPIPFVRKGESSAQDAMDPPVPGSDMAGELVGYDFRYANRERCDSMTFDTVSRIEARPKPLDIEKWAEPDANSFLVRGPMYKKDKVKINAGTSIGQLIAVDLVVVDKPIYTGMSKHPSERIQLALQREKRMKEQGKNSDMPPFIFVVNIILPGPPFYHGVFYYAVEDMSSIDGSDGTGSSRLAKQFLFGDSDEFRDRTFKLIPQIVAGNFMVRKAVGSTPAIMGTKLKQTYVRDKRFLEVVLDCGSSSVATGVIRLTLGYAKTLAVDMGFLLEGDDKDHLPEKIFGCVRMKFPEFGPHLRKVEPPTPKPLK
jgi:hypothetical protein